MVEHSWVVLLNSPSQQVVDHFDFLPLNLIAMLQKKKEKKKPSLKAINSLLISYVKLKKKKHSIG
jgi:hypothetical protein